MVKKFFDNSPRQFASFLTQDISMTQEELKDLSEVIDQLLESKGNDSLSD